MAAVKEPFFEAAINATKVLYHFLALNGSNVKTQPIFCADGVRCFQPSATMLTSLDTVPDTTPVGVPALYDHDRIEAALCATHGKFVFGPDNEVLFFQDRDMPNG